MERRTKKHGPRLLERAVFGIEPGALKVTNLLASSAQSVPDDSRDSLCANLHMAAVPVGEAARLDEAYIGSVYPDELAELRQRIALLEAEAAITRRKLASLRGRVDSVEIGA